MAFCSKCGNSVPAGAKFCPVCGMRSDIAQTKAVPNSNHAEAHRESYDGTVYKCPKCGEELKSFTAICPSCGYELRNTKGAGSVREFSRKLEEAASDEQRADLIRNFYIPNTREDIYEFFILATSNLNISGEERDAWKSKLDQAYQKAELVFDEESDEFKRLQKLYKTAYRKRRTPKLRAMKRSRLLQCAVMFGIGVLMMVIGSVADAAAHTPERAVAAFFSGGESGGSESPLGIIGLLGFFPIIGAGALFMFALFDGPEDKDE